MSSSCWRWCGLVIVCGTKAKCVGRPLPRWVAYGGGPEHIHFPRSNQINRENVDRLTVAWSYDTRDALEGSDMQQSGGRHGVMYVTSPTLRVIALDATTGKELWSFNPSEGQRARRGRNRGITYWDSVRDQRSRSGSFFGHQNWLYALDAETGRPSRGSRCGARRSARGARSRSTKLSIGLTTPGVIYRTC